MDMNQIAAQAEEAVRAQNNREGEAQPLQLQYKVAKNFEVAFSLDVDKGQIAFLVKQPWEKEFTLYPIRGSTIQKLVAEYTIAGIERAEAVMAAMKARVEEQQAAERRANIKKIDALGNVIEEDKIEKPAVEATYDVPPVPLEQAILDREDNVIPGGP